MVDKPKVILMLKSGVGHLVELLLVMRGWGWGREGMGRGERRRGGGM